MTYEVIDEIGTLDQDAIERLLDTYNSPAMRTLADVWSGPLRPCTWFGTDEGDSERQAEGDE